MTSKVGFSGVDPLNGPFQVLPRYGRNGSSALARLEDDSPRARTEAIVTIADGEDFDVGRHRFLFLLLQ